MLPNAFVDDMPPALKQLMAREVSAQPQPMSRRSFLKLTSLGGLALGAFPLIADAQGTAGAAAALKPTQQPSAFLHLAPDGVVTVAINRLEFGQGVQTALPMILAEELDADWSKVQTRFGDNSPAYADPIFGIHLTGGSNSIHNSFMQYRELGARARAMLLAAAAEHWQVNPISLRTENGAVVRADGHRLDYGELASAAMAQPVPEQVSLKDAKDFRLIGKPTRRLDAQAKSSGRQDFGLDLRLPGQLTALIAHPPVFGARLAAVDDAAGDGNRPVHPDASLLDVPGGLVIPAAPRFRVDHAGDLLFQVHHWPSFGSTAPISSTPIKWPSGSRSRRVCPSNSTVRP